KIAPGNDVEPFRFIVTFTVHCVPGTADRYRKCGNRPPRRGISHFRVTPQMTNNLNFVKASAHVNLLVSPRISLPLIVYLLIFRRKAAPRKILYTADNI